MSFDYTELTMLAQALEVLIQAHQQTLEELPDRPHMGRIRADIEVEIESARRLQIRVNENRW